MYRLGTGARNGSLKKTVRRLGYNILDNTLYVCNNTHSQQPKVNNYEIFRTA